MPKIEVTVESAVKQSFRVKQVAGLFDLDLKAKSRRSWSVQVPGLDEDWQIGAIVGPSGSGKTVVARKASGDKLATGFDWPRDKAVVEAFDPALSIKDVTGMLNSVGFSSPPAWVLPYSVLSNGQQFRCDLARALLTPADCLWFDEFTSVVDRQVAKFGSAAVAKTIRKGRTEHGARRFVAVTCHYDVLDWLQPDWVLDMASEQLARGWLQRERRRFDQLVHDRPAITLRVLRCHREAWRLFAPHHYLNADLPKSAHTYTGPLGRDARGVLRRHGPRGQEEPLAPEPDGRAAGFPGDGDRGEAFRGGGQPPRWSGAAG